MDWTEIEVVVKNKVVIKTQKIAPNQYIENIELIGKALKKGKSICTDGTFCKAQMLLSRIASRKSALGIMGKTGRKTWG